MSVHVIDHPLAQDKLTRLRSKKTIPADFRRLVMELAQILVLEATRDVKLKDVEVETPLAKTIGKKLAEAITLVPIMRAGLAMVEGSLQLLPSASVGHIGIYRDKLVRNTVEYYFRLSPNIKNTRVLVLDPMLATGDTACATLSRLKEYDVKHINFLCILASTVGLDKVLAEHPDVKVFTLSIEPELNDQDYILPGVGDAGDRIYGTVDTE
jgi:uracil phosphoribosyltransferase